jgi:hypothetical protein
VIKGNGETQMIGLGWNFMELDFRSPMPEQFDRPKCLAA